MRIWARGSLPCEVYTGPSPSREGSHWPEIPCDIPLRGSPVSFSGVSILILLLEARHSQASS